MKRTLISKAVAAALSAALVLASLTGCAGTEDKTITVGASPTPHAEILNYIAEDLAEQGYTLEVVEYNDYVLPNEALENEEIDANYFQHTPYLENFNEENGTHLAALSSIHYEPFGLYAGKTENLDKLENGASVAIPNDTTNEARALLLLEQEGLITLKEDAGITATVADIEENPKNLEIVELEAAQIPRSLDDVDIAAINSNYAIEAGLSTDNALAVEAAESLAAETYANIIAVKEGHENDEKIKALEEALLSDKVRTFIEENYDGAVLPSF